MIYLDNNATTKPYSSVTELVFDVLKNNFGNPSSVSYDLGRDARKIVDDARVQLAALLDCREEEIIFNSGGTESIYTALLGAARSDVYSKQLYISNVEHPAVNEAAKLLSELYSYDILKIDFKDIFREEIQIEAKEKSLFSVMLANNETGIIHPIEKLKACAPKTTFFHSDIVQGVGKLNISFSKLNIDAASLSAHKFGGPKGIGALILKKQNPWLPFFTAGGQESGRRGGTENVALIAGLGEAARISKHNLSNGKGLEIAEVRDRFEEVLSNLIPDLKIVGKDLERLPNTSCLILPGVAGFDLVEKLGRKGILISAGSACKTGTLEPSKNLQAMGFAPSECLGMIRVSFNFENTFKESEDAAQVIAETVKEYQLTSTNIIKEILNGSK